MPAAIVPASLEDRREAGEVGVDIGKRIHQGMTNAGLRRQVHDRGIGRRTPTRSEKRPAATAKSIGSNA